VNLSHLSPAQLRRTASIIEKIEKLQKKLNHLHGVKATASAVKRGRKRTKFSAAGIARIRAAQKARWAKIHAARGK
jgi:hypothetical protein